MLQFLSRFKCEMKSEKWCINRQLQWLSVTCCMLSSLWITHKGKCTISDSELGGLSTNVLDVLTASENMPRGSQLYLRMQQEAACVLLGSYLVCFHLLKLQQIFRFRHQLLHLSLSPNTTSTDLHSSLSSQLFTIQVLPRKHRLYREFPDKFPIYFRCLRCFFVKRNGWDFI